MKLRVKIKTALVLPIIVLSVIACGNQKKISGETNDGIAKTNSNDMLIFKFEGASVGPDYYRSYIIRVTPGQVYYAISDYRMILSEDSLKLTKDSYASFVKTIDALQIKKKDEVANEGCTGGHSEDLDLYPGSSKAVNGHTYLCGGKQYGDLAGDVVTAGTLFKALVPDLSGKIEATRKKN